MHLVQITPLADRDERIVTVCGLAPNLSTYTPTMQKPILSAEVESAVLDAIAQYLNKETWRSWGMDTLREQGSCVLIEGPPGTGKTLTAKWMAHKIKRGFKRLSVAEIGGGDPGSSEKGVFDFFADCKRRNWATVFMDEADHLIGDRRRISGDGLTWMLGTLEAIMMSINVYKGLVICATNHPQNLDAAIADRFMSIIKIGMPDRDARIKLWKCKWPGKFPLKPTESDIRRLSTHELNGRQIETVIVNVASSAIRRKTKPTLRMFETFCEREKAKRIDNEI